MRYRFKHYERIIAYEVTELEVEADSLNEAKETLLEYFDQGFVPSEEDTSDYEHVRILGPSELCFNINKKPDYTRCLEDGTRTFCGEFVDRL